MHPKCVLDVVGELAESFLTFLQACGPFPPFIQKPFPLLQQGDVMANGSQEVKLVFVEVLAVTHGELKCPQQPVPGQKRVAEVGL
ncbi:MAG: hypothetical protein ACXWNF_06210, partial [Isosphaeraceae bacterium]